MTRAFVFENKVPCEKKKKHFIQNDKRNRSQILIIQDHSQNKPYQPMTYS